MLLNLLIKDEKKIDRELYSSGPYWNYKNRRAIIEIKKKGLKDFRGITAGIGTSFADNLVLDIRNEFNIKGRIVGKIFSLPLLNIVFNGQINTTKHYLDSFIKILNENEDNINKRNNFAKSFGYKYSVNLIRHEKPIEEEYSKKLSKRILSISPLVQWHQFFSNKEKKRLINKYKNFVIDKNSIPDLFIMRKDDIFISNFQNLKILNYVQIFENQNFIILRKS